MSRASDKRHRDRIVRAGRSAEFHLGRARFFESHGLHAAADVQRVAAHVEAECAFRASRLLRKADPQPYDRYEAAYVAASIEYDTSNGAGGEAAAPLGLSL